MTETPAGETLLEGSHVLVAPAGGQSKLFGMMGMLGGAIGAAPGTAIDNAAIKYELSASAVKGSVFRRELDRSLFCGVFG